MAIESLRAVTPVIATHPLPFRQPLNPSPSTSPAPALPSPTRPADPLTRQLDAPTVRTRLADLSAAPAITKAGSIDLVPVDIAKSEVRFTFTQSGSIHARAVIHFEQPARGYPILGLGPEPTRTTIDGQTVRGDGYRTYVFPFDDSDEPVHPLDAAAYDDSGTRHRVLEKDLGPGAHTMIVEYELDHEQLFRLGRSKSIGASNGGTNFFWRLDDLGGYRPGLVPVHFSEAYAPSSMEYDHHSTTLEVSFPSEMRRHRIFCNGQVTELAGDNEAYRIEFPAYFNTSAPFLHLCDPADVIERQASYQSIDGREIPITIYSNRTNYQSRQRLEADHQESLKIALATLAEMETLLGPYPHASFVARIWPEGSPAMEYSGATETDPDSLRHELIHSWWGRGVFPADGDAGWLDEALTYWFQDGRPERVSARRADRNGTLKPLGAMQQHTANDAWTSGPTLISEIHQLIGSHPDHPDGLLPLMRELFDEYRHRSITVRQFRRFLIDRLPPELVPALIGLLCHYHVS